MAVVAASARPVSPAGGRPIARLIWQRLAIGVVTLLLVVLVFLAGAIGSLAGVALGAIAALRRDRWSDHVTSVVVLAVTSLPEPNPPDALVTLTFGKWKEILPNLVSPLMVETGLRLTYSIVIIAGLAFLGFGQPPPAANWGTMINENRDGLPLNPWAVAVPALLIALLTIGTNTFTDAFARVAIGVERRPQEAALLEDLGARATA